MMKKLKFIINVFFMLLLTRPMTWEYEYKKLKKEYNNLK
jgi:hypothetical protein